MSNASRTEDGHYALTFRIIAHMKPVTLILLSVALSLSPGIAQTAEKITSPLTSVKNQLPAVAAYDQAREALGSDLQTLIERLQNEKDPVVRRDALRQWFESNQDQVATVRQLS